MSKPPYTFRAATPTARVSWGHWLLSQVLGGAVGGISFHLLYTNYNWFSLNVDLALSTLLGACFNYCAGRKVVHGR